MKKRWIFEIVIALSILVSLLAGLRIYAWISKGINEKIPQYVFRYAENQSDNYPTTLGARKFADLVYERTDGRIKILVKCDAELGSEMQVIEQLKYGGIAFARVSLSQLAEYVPEMNILQMPFLYTDSDHMWRVLGGEIGDSFLDETAEYGVVGLSWYDAGARNFYSTKPITRIRDLAGMTIRVQESDLRADMITALGATPMKIVYSDVYSALEQGIVDGAENNWPSYQSTKHYKVAKYYTIDEHTRVPEIQLCSKVIWDQLDDSDRQIISECAKESALYERNLWQDREKSSREIAEKSGITLYELSAEEKQRFRDAVMPVYEKYCKNQMELVKKIMEY